MTSVRKWEVHPEIRLATRGLAADELNDSLVTYLAQAEIDAAAAMTLTDDGTVDSIGATFGITAATPGQATDEAVQHMMRACTSLRLAVDTLREVVVQPADSDPRL